MRRVLIGALVLVATSLAIAATALAQPKPEFTLGFRALADLIPNVVAEPVENEHHGANGDSLQATSRGLMAWRKADNWTAFTDGATTWINGPNGLESRPNGERFSWEKEPETPTSGPADPAPTPAPAGGGPTTLPAGLDHLGPDGKPLHVAGIAFSPDGQWLASAAYSPTFEADPTVKLWEVATGREARTLTAPKGWILGVAFSPDGQMLATAGSDGSVILWDRAGGSRLRTLSWPDWIWADSVAFSPDGKLVASGGSNGTIRLWETATGNLSRTLGEGDWTWTFGVAFSPDGRFLAAGSWDGNVELWDLSSNTQVKTLRHPWQVHEVAFSPDGRLLATGSRLGTVKLWDPATGNEVRTLPHDKKVNSVAFSPNGGLLAVGLASDPGGKAVYLWDVAGGSQVAALAGQRLWSEGVAFSPQGNVLASGGAGGDVKLWRIR